MTIRALPLLGLGAVLAAGCAGPLDRDWDDPLYQTLLENYREADRPLSTSPETAPSQTAISPVETGSLTLEAAVRLAIANHPVLRGAGYRVEAATGRALQAGLFPNPSVVYDAEGLGAEGASGGEQSLKIQQPIVLGGRLRNARSVAQADRLGAQARFRAAEFGVAADVSRAYFAALAAEHRLEAREKLDEVARRLTAAVTSRVEARAATLPDRLRAEVVVEQSGMELEAARFQVQAARRALAAIIGLDSTTVPDLVSPAADFSELRVFETVLARSMESNARVLEARIGLERARRAHELAKSQSVPDFVASIGPRFSDAAGETTLDLGLGLEIPLFDRNQGGIRAAIAERLGAAAGLRAVELELSGQVALVWSDFESAWASVARYEKSLLPKAEQTMRLTQESYELGKVEYLRLLDAQQVVAESQISYFDAMQRLHTAAVSLRELMMDESPWRLTGEATRSEQEVGP